MMEMPTRLKCPFCGATPHNGLNKVQYDQLHGEPFQTYSIWCPHGCARITENNIEAATTRWNTRATPERIAAKELLEALKKIEELPVGRSIAAREIARAARAKAGGQ